MGIPPSALAPTGYAPEGGGGGGGVTLTLLVVVPAAAACTRPGPGTQPCAGRPAASLASGRPSVMWAPDLILPATGCPYPPPHWPTRDSGATGAGYGWGMSKPRPSPSPAQRDSGVSVAWHGRQTGRPYPATGPPWPEGTQCGRHCVGEGAADTCNTPPPPGTSLSPNHPPHGRRGLECSRCYVGSRHHVGEGAAHMCSIPPTGHPRCQTRPPWPAGTRLWPSWERGPHTPAAYPHGTSLPPKRPPMAGRTLGVAVTMRERGLHTLATCP